MVQFGSYGSGRSFGGVMPCMLMLVSCLATESAVKAAVFASEVISYAAGTTSFGNLQDPASALGPPDGIVGDQGGFDSVLSLFNPAFESQEVVSVGEGGHLTLRLENFVLVGLGPDVGVVANAGLIDLDFPNGIAGNPASAFGVDSAGVQVSADGDAWIDLGVISFEMPASFYQDSGPFDTTPGSLVSDFGAPFDPVGGLSAFDGLNHGQFIALLGGSGGGQWLDLSSTGLVKVGFIRFSVADDGNAQNDMNFEIDAVSVANGKVGGVAPEPAVTGLVLVLAVFVARRRV
jgi:hypothetical protein